MVSLCYLPLKVRKDRGILPTSDETKLSLNIITEYRIPFVHHSSLSAKQRQDIKVQVDVLSYDRKSISEKAQKRMTTNLCRPGYINTISSVSVLDILDNVGVDSPLEIGALTSKVIIILLRSRNATVLGRRVSPDHCLHLTSDR